MSTLVETLDLLVWRLLADDEDYDVELSAEITRIFRQAFFSSRKAAKSEYTKYVVAKTHLSRRRLGHFLGYRSSGSIDAVLDGSMDAAKFDFMQANIGRLVSTTPSHPSLAELTTLALIETIYFAARRFDSQRYNEPPTREEFELVERILRFDFVERSHDSHEPLAILRNALTGAQRVAGTRILEVNDAHRVLQKWGPPYLLCKRLLPGCDGSNSHDK